MAPRLRTRRLLADVELAHHARLVMARQVAGKLQPRRLLESPRQFSGLARRHQHTVRVVVLHDLTVAHGTVVHFPHSRGGKHAAGLHLQHFLLVLCMHRRVAQVEFVQQPAFVDQHEAHGFTGFDVQRCGREGNVLQRDFHRARGLVGRCRLSEGVGVRPFGQCIDAQR